MRIAGGSISAPCHAVVRDVRTQLDRILASDIFARSERLSTFLRFVVEETIAGRGAELKEHTLGSQLYRKAGEFDGSADPIVRVDARRLRDKLREYYSQSPLDPVLISLPKGTYVPVFQQNYAGVLPSAEPQRRLSIRGFLIIAVAALLVLLLAVRTVLRTTPNLPARLIRITAFPGRIGAPSLSSDGKFVAFSWRGPDGNGEPHIWVKAVEGETLRRLTNTRMPRKRKRRGLRMAAILHSSAWVKACSWFRPSVAPNASCGPRGHT
jgi:hypothetical protein